MEEKETDVVMQATKTMTTGDKVNPIVKHIVEESRAIGLTLGEFHILAQLINWEYDKAKKEKEKKLLDEFF